MNRTHNRLLNIVTIASMLAMVIGFVALPAHAVSPPNIITYQGRVLDANGVSVSSSSLSMRFFLYTALTGGTCVWSNSSANCDSNTPASTTARTVTLTTGLFTENLGDTAASTPYAAIADSTFADNTGIYLAVEIAGETLSPRKQLVAAPYALNAETLDGIDLSVIQLWEVGAQGSYEDDAAVIVGANAVFSYASGGTGDLRIADEIEVLGDGFVDNDLVVGASVSSTETITNAGFSLSGDDLFVASDAGIEGNLYIDGAINLVGTATVGDLSCTDCLDFAELSDTLALDASTSITQDGTEALTITNSGSGNTIINLSSTGDFVVQDNGTAVFTVDDSGNSAIVGTLGITNASANDSINIAGAGTGTAVDIDSTTYGTDLELQNGLTIDNNTDNDLAIIENSITVTLDFDEVASTVQLETASDFDIDGSANGEDAIEINASAGGINILASGAADGEDIDIIATGSSVNVSSTQAAVDAITLFANAETGSVSIRGGDNAAATPAEGGNDVFIAAEDDLIISASDDARFSNGDDFSVALAASGNFLIDAATTNSTTVGATSGTMSITIDADPAATSQNNGLYVDYEALDDLNADQTFVGALIDITATSGDAADTIYGLQIQNLASANTTDALLRINNADIDTATTVGLLIDSSAGGITRAIDINSSSVTTDIQFQNDETISNDTDGQIIFGVTGANELSLSATALFPSFDSGLDLGTSSAQFADLYLDGGNVNLDNATDIDIDDNTASALTITEGATNYFAIITTNSSEVVTLGSSSLTQLAITTDDNAVNDIAIAGSVVISNDLTVVDDFVANGDVNITLDDGDTVNIIGDGSSTTTMIDLSQTTLTTDADAIALVLTQSDGAASGVDNVGLDMFLTGNDADGDMFGVRITAGATANAGVGTYEAGILITNSENTAGSMPDAILISSGGIDAGITDAIDVSDANITNAINARSNFYVMDGIRFFEGTTGTLTIEDVSGNDLMTLQDASNAGALNVTGALSAQAGAPFTDWGSVAATSAVIGQQTQATALPANRNDVGGYFSVTSNANPGAFIHELYGAEGIATYTNNAGSVARAIYGVNGVALHSSSALTVSTAAGIRGAAQATLGGGTITTAIGVDGLILTGLGDITSGYGGRFVNTSDGTTRYGIYAEAASGTNNFAGYFTGSAVHVATDSTPATPALATGAGDLYVESDIEVDSDVQIDGGDLLSGATTFNFFDAASNSTTIDIGGVDTNLGNTINIASNSTTADAIIIGNTNPNTSLALTGGDDWRLSNTGLLSIAPASTGTFLDFSLETEWTAGSLINADFTMATTQTAEAVGVSIDFTNFTPITDTYGVRIVQPSGTAAGFQYGMFIAGTNWDYGLNIEDLVSVGLGSTASTTAVCSSLANSTAPTSGVAYELRDCSGAPAADYAEQYPVAAGITYGDIVVPGAKTVVTQDGQTIVELVKSSAPYQGPVSGIVSNNYYDFTSAGYNINKSDNPMPVALVGRVPVNVTNENGSIKVGDYITTSSTPGFAMKATEVGRVIGMALADFSSATGQVMVQVNNGWYLGNIIGSDGTSTMMNDKVVMAPLNTATAEQSFDSYGFALRGSAWDGAQAQAVEMLLKASVTNQDEYRLSVRNTTDAEVAYITNEGTMKVAGDMIVSGKLYPSDRGVAQTDKYIYYDGSSGPAGDFMRTNAKGWSTGSYDFAEMFPSTEELQPGEVVVFAQESEYVHRSTQADESGIVGIVSTRPGFLAGENLAGSYPIALAGRVPTFVTTENGEIKVGDPLTTSSKPGYTMKATESGVVVGYALEPITSGEGSILSYVNVGYWEGEKTTSAPGTDNRASQISVGTNVDYTSLNMSGNIYLTGNEIVSIGRLAGIGDIWTIEQDGTIKTESVLKTVIRSYTDEKVETVAVTSPEVVITLSGTSKLSGGSAEVRFENVSPEFNDVIQADASIRVVVTPNGPVSLFVSEKDNNHFIVKRFGGEQSDVEFDWIVTAYRKGYEPVIASQLFPELVEGIIDEAIPNEEIASSPAAPRNDAETVDPAPPVSPDTNIIDSAVEVDGGEQAEEPTETQIENLSPTQEDEQL